MSSGSFTSPGLGFNNTGAPTHGGGAPCPTARYETTGRNHLWAGLCHHCGRTTTRTAPGGQPEHDQVEALAWTWDMVVAERAAMGAIDLRPAAA